MVGLAFHFQCFYCDPPHPIPPPAWPLHRQHVKLIEYAIYSPEILSSWLYRLTLNNMRYSWDQAASFHLTWREWVGSILCFCLCFPVSSFPMFNIAAFFDINQFLLSLCKKNMYVELVVMLDIHLVISLFWCIVAYKFESDRLLNLLILFKTKCLEIRMIACGPISFSLSHSKRL